MHIKNNLSDSNIQALLEGAKVLETLTMDQYQASRKPIFESTIGAHFRHILEHYQSFFTQLTQQHFCYDSRQRNFQLETDIIYARKILSNIITEMQNLPTAMLDKSYTLSDESISGKIETSLVRELVFLQAHTTHHFAIIAAIARSVDVQTEKGFGVAIATKNHQLKIQTTEGIACAQ